MGFLSGWIPAYSSSINGVIYSENYHYMFSLLIYYYFDLVINVDVFQVLFKPHRRTSPSLNCDTSNKSKGFCRSTA